MANLALQFGSYALPGVFALTSDPMPVSVPMAKIPRAYGSRVSTAYPEGKVITFEGAFAAGLGVVDPATLRTAISTLRANLQGLQNLQAYSDRYWRNCYLKAANATFEGVEMARFGKVSLQFATGDPFEYSTTTTTASAAITGSGQTLAAPNGGEAFAAPAISLTVGGSGAQTLSCTLTNSTTGEAFTLNGACNGGDVFVVDTLNKTVTISGADKTALFDGLLLPSGLLTGANTLTVAYTSATITNISVAFNARYF